jgi:tetratricopeptide (TPR) repeat protein
MNLMDELLEVESENMRALYLRGRAFYHKKEIP